VSATREERIKANNDRFRSANDTIHDRAEQLGADMELLPFLCECPVENCVEIVRLTRGEYETLRDNPQHYMTAVGHEDAEKPVGEVIERRDGYVVIEKAS
jgi:hypothetical protein